jgi:TorA maturation chaperone TorD
MTPTSTTAAPLRFADADDDAEELARAEVYGLLAAVFKGAPDELLYEGLKVAVTEAPTPGAFLESSWSEVVAVARRLTRAQVVDEYGALFGGVGKPEVFLHGSYFIAGHLNEQPLADLRSDLAVLGLARPASIAVTEDHLANLCEVMRYLIAGDDIEVCNLTRQRSFFDRHLRGWTEALCAALVAHPRADFYRASAAFTRDFLAVEAQAFDLLDV